MISDETCGYSRTPGAKPRVPYSALLAMAAIVGDMDADGWSRSGIDALSFSMGTERRQLQRGVAMLNDESLVERKRGTYGRYMMRLTEKGRQARAIWMAALFPETQGGPA